MERARKMKGDPVPNTMLKSKPNAEMNANRFLFCNELQSGNPNQSQDVDGGDVDGVDLLQSAKCHRTVSTPMGFKLSRSEMVSVVLQYLDNAGYSESARCLARESGASFGAATGHELTHWVLAGDWLKVIDSIHSLNGTQPETLCLAKALVLEQKLSPKPLSMAIPTLFSSEK